MQVMAVQAGSRNWQVGSQLSNLIELPASERKRAAPLSSFQIDEVCFEGNPLCGGKYEKCCETLWA